MLELKPIRVLLAVADLQSFTAAARELGLAPASVTRIISQLEEDFGAQLLVRTTRKVALTSAGATVIARYRPLIDGFDQVAEEFQRSVRPDIGHLRLTAPVSLGIDLLPKLLAGFRLGHPGISVDVNFTDTLLDVIAENCDLAVRVSGPPTDKSTIWRKLCEVPMRAVAAPSLFNRIAWPEHPTALQKEYMMSYSADGTPETWAFSKNGKSHMVHAGTQIIANNGDFLYAMAEAGEGICVLPSFICDAGLQQGRVVEVLPDWTLPSLWLTLFYPPYEQLPPVVATFADYFERFIEGETSLN